MDKQDRASYEQDKYRFLNKFIEEEGQKENYSNHPDIDGTVAGYMEIILDFFVINLFGLVCPIAFNVFFIINMFRIYLGIYLKIFIFIIS